MNLPEALKASEYKNVLGRHKLTEVASLEDFPEQIRTRLIQHLVDRLGDEYYLRLLFVSGQIIDFDEIKHIDQNPKNYVYRAVYRVSDLEKGIASYDTSIDLNNNGDVVAEIKIPSVRHSPEKADFISLNSMYRRVLELRMKPTSVRLGFSGDDDAIVFRFTQELRPMDGALILSKSIVFSAHTGKILG